MAPGSDPGGFCFRQAAPNPLFVKYIFITIVLRCDQKNRGTFEDISYWQIHDQYIYYRVNAMSIWYRPKYPYPNQIILKYITNASKKIAESFWAYHHIQII